jgi:hypothetical protein
MTNPNNHLTSRPSGPSPRWMTGLGIVFAALFALSIVLTGNQPGIKASPAKLISFYNDHHNVAVASSFAIFLAMVAFGFFAGAVSGHVNATGRRSLVSVATAGSAIFISGVLLLDAVQIALLDAAHNHQGATAQVLNYLSQDAFFPMIGGLAVFLLAIGSACVRSAALPAWLSWATLVVGVLCLAGPLGALGFLLVPVWALATSIVLLARSGRNPDGGPLVDANVLTTYGQQT